MDLDLRLMGDLLQAFDFRRLFTEVLGWSQPKNPRPTSLQVGERTFTLREVAQLGAKVFEVQADDEQVPAPSVRAQVYAEVAKSHHESLLIFVDGARRQSQWFWAKREGSKLHPRDSLQFLKGQPPDLAISRLAGLHFDIADLDETGNVHITEVAKRLKDTLDVERVTKRFYTDYQEQHLAFLEHIEGIADERDRRWYASVLLNRLMFVYFLQKKGFLDGGDVHYLGGRLRRSRQEGPDRYFERFLRLLFFEGFAKPEAERSTEARRLLGNVRYLNGGLFLRHRIEIENADIRIADVAFENLLALFDRYSWSLDDTPGGKPDEINPDVLGYIFEKYINQKAFGAYYTRPEITEYLCEQTLHQLILDRMSDPDLPGMPGRRFDSIGELLLRLDGRLCRKLLLEVLPSLSILDPACGSGAFLVAALRTLVDVYFGAIGRAEVLKDPTLTDWLRQRRVEHRSLLYYVKKAVITDNLYGVDVMEEATEIARLRLFLALVSSTSNVDELEPLPNIDFNVLTGNSLIGLLHVESREFDATQGQGDLFRKSYRQLVAEKDREVQAFRHATSIEHDLRELRDHIEELRREARPTLDRILLSQFQAHKILFEQATWDAKQGALGKPDKRPLTADDLEALQPFHWGYEFDQVLARGGFDAILTNPPWEAWKPQAKEFFAEHSDLVTKNLMTIKEFEKEQAKLLRDREVCEAWLEYLSRFPHVSLYFRTAPQYKNQIAMVKGVDGKEKKAGTDVNLYKLFLEQCFNLLREGGRCGILLPTGVYTDLGAKQLRQMLFERTRIDALYGLSNERFLFEGVHHSFRICLLTFEKGVATERFEAAFRINPREAIAAEQLDSFLHDRAQHVEMTVDLVRRLSPDSLSLMELKNERDVTVVEKMLRFPLLGERIDGAWNLRFTRELDMTNDSYLFKSSPGAGRLPLYEGKMIHQFDSSFAAPRYWVSENDARRVFASSSASEEGPSYQRYRLGYRDVAMSTNERTMIATVVPKDVLCGNTVIASLEPYGRDLLTIAGFLNSFVFDYGIRKKVMAHCNMFYVYQMPCPRLAGDAASPVVERVARLVCTTPDFSSFWQETIGVPWSPDVAATDPAERARLRAELDGLVSHLYGLTEDEFVHVLSAFPVVPQKTKDAALAAFRDFAPKTADPALAPLLLAGEGARIEYKSTLRWDLDSKRVNPVVESAVVKTVAGFLNAAGGTLLIGVADDASPVGIEHDYPTVHKHSRDGFELHLTNLLLSTFGKDVSACLAVTFHRLGERDVCKVEVRRAHRPVFVSEGRDESFYLRAGNSTRKLSGSELLAYEKTRWGAPPPAPSPDGSGLGGTVHYAGAPLPSPLEHTPLFRRPAKGEREPTAPATSEAEPAESPPPSAVEGAAPSIDDLDASEIICTIRDVFSQPGAREGLDREETLRRIARALRFARLGPRIREVLEGQLLAAARRRIVNTEHSVTTLATRSIADYDRETLREQLLAAASTTWTERDEAIRLAARRIGFRRTGSQIRAAFTSALRGALQTGKLEASGSSIRRAK